MFIYEKKVVGSNTVAVPSISDIVLILSKEFVDVQAISVEDSIHVCNMTDAAL